MPGLLTVSVGGPEAVSKPADLADLNSSISEALCADGNRKRVGELPPQKGKKPRRASICWPDMTSAGVCLPRGHLVS